MSLIEQARASFQQKAANEICRRMYEDSLQLLGQYGERVGPRGLTRILGKVVWALPALFTGISPSDAVDCVRLVKTIRTPEIPLRVGLFSHHADLKRAPGVQFSIDGVDHHLSLKEWRGQFLIIPNDYFSDENRLKMAGALYPTSIYSPPKLSPPTFDQANEYGELLLQLKHQVTLS